MNEPIYTQDWFSENIPVWERVLSEFKGKYVNVLELGVFEGRATRWLLENIVDRGSIWCVDTFEGSLESAAHNVNLDGLRNRFFNNISGFTSHDLRIVTDNTNTYSSLIYQITKKMSHDIIYIDASHVAKDVMLDIQLSWKLLKSQGILIMDDYDWTFYSDPKLTPKAAIDFFLMAYEGEYELLEKNHQVIVRKL